jgi:hypothetical protein
MIRVTITQIIKDSNSCREGMSQRVECESCQITSQNDELPPPLTEISVRGKKLIVKTTTSIIPLGANEAAIVDQYPGHLLVITNDPIPNLS